MTLDAAERSSLLATAIDSVRRAGQLQREAFGGTVELRYQHKKQYGGLGQFAEVKMIF